MAHLSMVNTSGRRCGGAAVVSDHDQSDQFLPQRLRLGGSVSLANLAQRTAGAVALGDAEELEMWAVLGAKYCWIFIIYEYIWY